MTGEVDETGTPVIRLTIADREWLAAIDTGFNGDLELPAELKDHFSVEYAGESSTTLGAGVVIEEELYEVSFPFDDEIVVARVTFAPVEGILIGTGLLRKYRLEINFVTRTVALEKVASN
jgi:predicted aspartyl protease